MLYIVDDVSPVLVRWLARWPRVTVHYDLDPTDSIAWRRPSGLRRDETIFLPADARCDTVAELAALEQERRGPVRIEDFPTEPVPEAKLLPMMQAFESFAAAARLTPDHPLPELFAAAEPGNPACALAVAQLLSRTDAFDVMVHALHSDYRTWQGAGAAMAFATTPSDPRLVDVLGDILGHMQFGPRPVPPARPAGAGRCEELLAVLERHEMATPAILSSLRLIQRRVVRFDEELARAAGRAIRTLTVSLRTASESGS